jgi:hypothetical protein
MSHVRSSLDLSNLMSLETNPHVMNLKDPLKTGEIGLVTKTIIDRIM